MHDVPFKSYDVLEDNDLRLGQFLICRGVRVEHTKCLVKAVKSSNCDGLASTIVDWFSFKKICLLISFFLSLSENNQIEMKEM